LANFSFLPHFFNNVGLTNFAQYFCNKLCDVHLGCVVLLLFDFHGCVALIGDTYRLQLAINDDEV
jgi:hypothetical protein